MAWERTLSIVKPDGVRANRIGAVLERVERAGLRIAAVRMASLTKAQAEAFYAVHKERPFFASLVEFMTSGPVVASVLEGENAIQKYRDLMGATDPAKAAPGTIRRDFAETVQNNVDHGSDGPDTAHQEVAFFFNQADLVAGERR